MTAIPDLDFFIERREPCGERRLRMRLGPISIELDAVDERLHRDLTERYERYVVEAGGGDPVRLRLHEDAADYFIPRPDGTSDQQVHLRPRHNRVHYLGFQLAAWFSIALRRGTALFSQGDYEPRGRALENLIRSVVAWEAAERGGGLVHAASAVHDGKAYLFYGESGAGKSTLSACNRRARVVSDDLSLVLPIDGALHLVGSPFRGTYEEGEPVVGHFPLAAGFRLIKAPEARVAKVPRSVAFSGLVANLPFVAESFSDRPDLFDSIQRGFAAIPLAHLEFRKDDSYWDAIEAADL